MIEAIRLLVFILSNIGLWEIIRRNSKISEVFLPGLTIAIQTCILFCAGLLNLLLEATYAIHYLGLISLVYFLIKDKNIRFIRHYLQIGYFYLFFVFLAMLFFFRDQVFTHYDNFSHWALVVKSMLSTDRYPNFKDPLIQFSQYPLGSATYIYYFARLVKPYESIQMLAQGYMLVSSILPLFYFVKKRKLISTVIISAATLWFLTCNIAITDLLVDTLLPLVATAGLIYAHIYSKQTDRRFEFFASSFYITQLVLIKHSGILFALFIMIPILISIRHDHKVFPRLLCVALPFAALLLWNKHCEYVFVNAAYSKHSMTTSYLQAMFGKKTKEDIQTIISVFFRRSIFDKDVLLTLGIVVFVTILAMLIFKNRKKHILFALMLFAVYAIYQIGMLGMYLFSMPLGEALILASFERYTKTILIFIMYLILIPVLQITSQYEAKTFRILGLSLILLGAFGLYIHASSATLEFTRASSQQRNWIENVKKNYDIPNRSSYTVLIPDHDDGYMYYLCRYIFQSPTVSDMIVESSQDLDQIDTEYMLIFDQENEIIKEWVLQYFPAQYGHEVIYVDR